MDGSRRDSCLDVVFLWNLFVLLSFFFFNDTATTEIYTLSLHDALPIYCTLLLDVPVAVGLARARGRAGSSADRSEEHTSELQSRLHLVCRLLLEKKKQPHTDPSYSAVIIHVTTCT